MYIPFAQRMQEQYGKVPQFVGAVLVYLLYNRFEMNKQERDQELLYGKDLDAFLDDCCELLSYVFKSYVGRNKIKRQVKQ